MAIQLGTVRFLGTFLDAPTAVPQNVIDAVAEQLGVVNTKTLATYLRRPMRWRHAEKIRKRYDYREFNDPGVQFRLNRWLYALCWTGSDRPGALFDRAVAWLLANKVLLPGIQVLERFISRVRAHATGRLPSPVSG